MPKHIGTTQEVSLFTDSVTHRLMEVIVKAHFLLASALFVFVQITAPQAQVTVDVSKITCDQLLMEKPVPAKYVVLWLSGYYNGKRNNTIIEPEAMDQNEQKVDFYCNFHRDTTVMDAVKNVLGLDK
jgi:acid stress chaperone HdeB